MKKILLASGIVLLLAACGNDEPEETPEEETEIEEESTDEEESEETSEETIDTAAAVIEKAQSLHGDVISHEVVLTTQMTIEEDITDSTSSTMIDEDGNLQLQFLDSDGNTVTHYYLQDGNSFTHRNEEFTDLEADITNEGATYGDLLETLDKFSEAELTNSTDGYTIISEINELSDLTPFLDEQDLALFEERAEEVSGEVEINFNSDFVYTDANLNITITTTDSDIGIQTDIEVLNVGNIDFIVLPDGAPSESSSPEGASEGNDEVSEEEAEENIDSFESDEEAETEETEVEGTSNEDVE